MRLLKIESKKQIPKKYAQTPIGDLIRYQNLSEPLGQYDSARLLVGMCMDNRKQLRIPENFAYILRTGGGNLRASEFKVSYAVAIGGIRHIALIAHDRCGMVGLTYKREAFISGLEKNAGWTRERAEEHFLNFAPIFEIDNEIDFVLSESSRLAKKYPKVTVAALYYTLNDNMLSVIEE
jgi:carbonic anhydrase